VTNDNGGTAAASDFTLAADGPTDFSGPGNSPSVTNNNVMPGAYTLSETGPSGYSASSYSCVKNSGSPVSSNSITLAGGDTATCTITNNDVAPQLTLVKTVTNDNGGTADASAWTLNATGSGGFSGAGSPATGATATKGPIAVTAGVAYALSESGGPAGYTPSATFSCVTTPAGGSAGSPVDTNSITLGLGDSATCTINNNDAAPQLTLVKTVTNDNGGTADASAWTLNATGSGGFSGAGSPATGATATKGPIAVTAGVAYALSESGGPAGYTPSATFSCVTTTATGYVGSPVNTNSLTLGVGASATCTITNNDIAPSLTLIKVVDHGSTGRTELPSAWTLSATGATTVSGTASGAAPNPGLPLLAGSVASGSTFVAGTYTLGESGPGGYVASGWNCTGTGNQQDNQITLGVGQSATCTIRNTAVNKSEVTDSSLCTFDVNTSADNRQFRLIYTPDQGNGWKLNASNPGQYYYNVFYFGPGNADVTLDIPFPFVTHGANPVHVYSNVTTTTSGGKTCFIPGAGLPGSSYSPTTLSLPTGWTLPGSFGSNQNVVVHVPPTGAGNFAYINIHLDYGLKGTTGYSKGGVTGNDAMKVNTSDLAIADNQEYTFNDTVPVAQGQTSGDPKVYSQNAFKRDPGIGGLVQVVGSTQPVANVKVEIYDGAATKPTATVYTDEDGWYMWQYKNTGKASNYTVKLPSYNLSQTIPLKANGYVVVSFTVPAP
jgi:hypothetical protein